MTDHNVTTVKSVMTRSSGTASKYPTIPARSPHLSVRFSSFLPWVGKENEIISTTGGSRVVFAIKFLYKDLRRDSHTALVHYITHAVHHIRVDGVREFPSGERNHIRPRQKGLGECEGECPILFQGVRVRFALGCPSPLNSSYRLAPRSN